MIRTSYEGTTAADLKQTFDELMEGNLSVNVRSVFSYFYIVDHNAIFSISPVGTYGVETSFLPGCPYPVSEELGNMNFSTWRNSIITKYPYSTIGFYIKGKFYDISPSKWKRLRDKLLEIICGWKIK